MGSLSVEVENDVQKSTSLGGDDFKEVEGVNKEKMQITKTKKPTARLKPPTALERVFGKKKTTKHYFTSGAKINDSNQRNIHTEPSPFKYPADLEEFSYRVMTKAWRDAVFKKESKYKYNERYSYRTRQKLDLLNRLYVKEPEVASMRTILDLDPDFFTIIEGRPVPQNFNRRNYVEDTRDVLRYKIICGYREDEILLIEENFSVEQKSIDEITKQFQKYINNFEEFLFSDHTLSMALLRQSEEEATIAAEKYDIFRNLSKEFGSIKSVVYNLEEKWRNCKMYQKFLYLMSPQEWRIEHDYFEIKKSDAEEQEDSDNDDHESSIFGRYKLASTGEVLSLENLIVQFLDDVKLQDSPLLYFKTPSELLKVFGFIEIQNLNSLLHSEELAGPLANVKEGMDQIHNKFDVEMVALQDIIDSLEGGIIWEEQRAKYLEELALELIYGDFKNLISNDDVINLHVFVEDVYESRIAVNDSNLNMSDMMKMIELAYRDLLLQLDRLPSTTVYRAEMDCYKEEAKIMAVATDAAKKVIQIERLIKHLARLLEPPIYRCHRELKWRSAPKFKKKKPPPPPKPLTDEEIHYLTYFVDFCHHTDDPKEFGIRVHKEEKKINTEGQK